MIITDGKKIIDIQKEFNQKFPGLKIEFYKEAHEKGEGSNVESTINLESTIMEVRTIHNSGDLSIDGHQKVSTLEAHFKENYGLNVQVFRKSGNLWLQTTATDGWTLSKQNRKGIHSELAFKEKYS